MKISKVFRLMEVSTMLLCTIALQKKSPCSEECGQNETDLGTLIVNVILCNVRKKK